MPAVLVSKHWHIVELGGVGHRETMFIQIVAPKVVLVPVSPKPQEGLTERILAERVLTWISEKKTSNAIGALDRLNVNVPPEQSGKTSKLPASCSSRVI